MSAARDLLRLAESHGVRIAAASGKLRLSAPQPPPPGLLDEMRQHKAELLAALAAEDLHHVYCERAGIVEFDGQRSRTEAEHEAFNAALATWLLKAANDAPRQHGDTCPACGRFMCDLDRVAVLGHGSAHIELHSDCVTIWNKRRLANAASTLAALGIAMPEGWRP